MKISKVIDLEGNFDCSVFVMIDTEDVYNKISSVFSDFSVYRVAETNWVKQKETVLASLMKGTYYQIEQKNMTFCTLQPILASIERDETEEQVLRKFIKAFKDFYNIYNKYEISLFIANFIDKDATILTEQVDLSKLSEFIDSYAYEKQINSDNSILVQNLFLTF